MSVLLASIVEGHGEVQALPILLRRMQSMLVPSSDVYVDRPHRVSRNELLRPNGLERRLELLKRSHRTPWRVMVLIDADDDCPAELGPALKARIQAWNSNLVCGVVLANREFESWFLASLSSLAGKSGLREGLDNILDAEFIRGAKERMSQSMVDKRVYSPSRDQAKFAALMDLELSRNRSRSFDKFCREVGALLRPP